METLRVMNDCNAYERVHKYVYIIYDVLRLMLIRNAWEYSAISAERCSELSVDDLPRTFPRHPYFMFIWLTTTLSANRAIGGRAPYSIANQDLGNAKNNPYRIASERIHIGSVGLTHRKFMSSCLVADSSFSAVAAEHVFFGHNWTGLDKNLKCLSNLVDQGFCDALQCLLLYFMWTSHVTDGVGDLEVSERSAPETANLNVSPSRN